jgi:hypothetical protein
MDQAAPIYVPPSGSTRAILPVPQREGQGDYHYGMPGQAAPVYIPPSPSAGKRMAKNTLSDERSKSEIKRLESTNEALTQALDQATNSATQGNLPATEYPKLPQNTRLPSRANFADTPAANTVAAQNVGLLQSQAAPQMAPTAAPLVPTPPVPRPMANPGFNPGRPMPDLSELDQAYRNIGRQQGGG